MGGEVSSGVVGTTGYVAGEEAGWVEDGAAAAGERETSVNAGFSQSIDTESL